MEVLESHGEELSNDGLMQMEQQRAAEQEDNESDDALPPRSLSTKDLSEAFEHLNKAMAMFTEKEPQRERSLLANRIITSGYNYYKPIG